MKTIPCHISSAFPTLASVDEAVSLARRAGLKGDSDSGGEGVVIGLGTGAAIDLAKAVADTLFENNISSPSSSLNDGDGDHGGGTLLLAPCTLGGLWAASSNHPAILLDTKEEVLLPHRTPRWRNMSKELSAIRKGTVVTMDPMRYWAMPPLYAPFRPAKRTDYSSSLLPPMAHVAAAALAILLDVARSIDVVGSGVGTSNVDTTKQQHKQQTMMLDMKEVASSCASVLVLATHEAKAERHEEHIDIAQQHLVDAISRLTSILEQSSPHTTTSSFGTIPQTLASALLPTYFPQCHYITYLASTLPGLCDMLTENSPSSSSSSLNGKDESMVGMIASSILESSNAIDSTMQISSSSKASSPSSLSSWATHMSANAGLPSMASLAYGTPDMNALVNSLDSYTALMGSEGGHAVGGSSLEDDYWVMEDILRRGLHR